MSTEIDSKVVEMRFDNKHFERNVATTMSSLEKFKQKLNFKDHEKSFDGLTKAAKKVDLSSIGNSAEKVGLKFSALFTVADQTLRNITNSAEMYAKRIVSAFTIDPIKTGFQEYETQINSVQTILANTESKGSTLQDVNNALAELNTYADKTIYNFTEMTRNIGTFTAAGVDLKTSVSAIKGIANLAAVSGSNSQQASTAMYQLSQALASGTVKLMDWNSVVNAGMGGQVFQDSLKETARVHGVNIDAMIKKEGSFRETLQNGWLTSEILTETLSKFTGDLSEAQLKSLGYTDEQIAGIMKLGKTANDAATKVKTFTQLFDTLKEAAQSGWTKSWELLIGDFGEAKELLTDISDLVGGVIGDSADKRNKMLMGGLSTGWKQLLNEGIHDAAGFEEMVSNVAKEHGVDIASMVDDEHTFQDVLKQSLKEGKLNSEVLGESISKFTEKVGAMSAEQLENAGYTAEQVKKLNELNEKVKNGTISMEEFTKLIIRPSGRELLIESLWNSIKGLQSVLTPIKQAFEEVFPATTGEQLYNLIERFNIFTEKLTLSSEEGDKIKRIFKGVFSILDIGKKIIVSVADALASLVGSDGVGGLASGLLSAAASLGDFFTALNEGFDKNGLVGFLTSIVTGFSNVLESAVGPITSFGDAVVAVGNFLVGIANKIWDVVRPVFTWIAENISIGDIFAGLAGGGIFILAKKLSGVIDKIVDAVKKLFGDGDGLGLKKMAETFGEALTSLKDSLSAFAMSIKVSSLVSIAVAVGILSLSLKAISQIKTGDLVKSLTAIGLLFGGLVITMTAITKTLNKFGSKGLVKASFSLMLIAGAVGMLTNAIEKMSELSLPELVNGLIGIGVGLGILVGALKLIGNTKASLKTAVVLLALAESCKIMGDALVTFGSMAWDEIGRGLTAMAGALAELVIAMAVLQKFSGCKSLAGSLGILIVVQSLEPLADALIKFGSMAWGEIGRGLTAMGGALLDVGVVAGALGMISGMSGIVGGAAIWITVQSLGELADALIKFGSMQWDEIGRGLTAMGGALLEVGLMSGALGMIAGVGGIIGGAAIWVTVQSLDELANALIKFGAMAWDEIGRGLVAMGGALLEVGAISGGVGMIAGMSGIVGGAAIWVTVQSLDKLANALIKFGSMQWDEIGRGLVAMGAAMLEVSAISGGVGAIAGLSGIIGGASLWVTVQGLDDLANALIKFGSMSWDEIGRGLSAMGGALGETAIGGLANSLSFIGGWSIDKITGPLGDLADSVKKWADVTVPEGLGEQLGILAEGVGAFTFTGLGAGALSESAVAVGTLADSVKKWTGVTVPEDLPEKMNTLATGVRKFWDASIGAGALADSAAAVGILATSIKKWTDVTVPENLQSNLESVANGVKAFSFAFAGGWSMSSLVEPLGSLSDSVKKWETVSIPDTVKTSLENLAAGVGSFKFSGNWTMSGIVKPISDLADSVSKWSTVTLPEGVQGKLESIAAGISAFSSADDISGKAKALKSLSNAVSALSGISYDSVSTGLSGIATAAKDALTKFTEAFAVPNTTVTTAINGFMTSVATTLSNHKNENSAFYTNAKSLGKYLVEGFATGIKNNTYLAEQAVTALTNAAQTKANANLKVNSPSKVFMVTGGSVVEGFAKGITDNLGDIKKSAIILGDTMLKATQDNLEINSPSLVFDKKVGRYVVQGIAKGISKETAAEKAAKEKASAIVEAFQKELDKLGTESGIAEKIFNNWLNGEGKYAADDVVDTKELEYLTGELTRAEKRQSWAYNEWQETVAHLGEGSADERKAWDKYLAEQGNVIDAQNKISDVQQRTFDRRYEAIENEQALADAQYNLWSATNEATARDVEKDAKHLTYLNDNLKRLNSRVLIDVEAYNKAIELYGKESDEAKAALIKCLETDKEIVDTQNEIAQVHIDSVSKMINEMESIADMRDLDYDLWLSGDGRNATEAAKDAKQISVLRENAKTYNDEVKALKLEYDRLVRLYGTGEATAEQVMEAERNLKNKMIERNNINNDIEDLLENENTRLIRQHELASSNADLEYQIWEKTAGRKATSAEKDIARLVVLSKQLSSSTAIVNTARDEWTKAIKKYGRSSNEAQEAYSEYLNKQLDLANIQNEITDINENTVKRQKLAQSEYQDYIEKYKKFYSENGMSQAQLENDAKLITGYNPNSTVNTMIGKTNDALEKITDTPEYNELVNNFKNLGLSYVDAVNEGVESETSIVVNTVSTMVTNCITAIKDTEMSWLEAGRQVVLGFSEGIRLSIQQAVETAVLLAQATENALRTELDIHSPSRALMTIGKYAVMGLAQGFIDNSNIAEEAATRTADNLVANIQSAIQQASEMAHDSLDVNPTIRPVLDLSNVEAGRMKLNTMFSRAQAMAVSARMSRDTADERQNGVADSKAGNTYQFTQINNSPKALSRAEIYRQTKNQFTALKEVLE